MYQTGIHLAYELDSGTHFCDMGEVPLASLIIKLSS